MDFQHYQRAFTARIRDPRAHVRPPGASAQRMRVYEDLLYNNLEGFLLACFPVSRKILGARRWTRLVRAFMREHACRTPYFRQIPEEFLKFLQGEWVSTAPGTSLRPKPPPAGAKSFLGRSGERLERPDDFPAFLPELAHYEWVELELDTSDRDRDLPVHDPDGDLLAGVPLANPVMRVLAYRWPVQRLSPRYRPAEPPAEATFLVAWRDAGLEVRFNLVSPATARLLDLLQGNEALTGAEVLARLAAELRHPDPAALSQYGLEQMRGWHAEGILLGARA